MNIRVLIIDDDMRWAKFVERELREFEVVIAPDVHSAFEALKTTPFDLIIVSPRHFDDIKLIKSKYPNQRVVAVTMQSGTEEQLKAYRSGAIRYFAKSFNREDILSRIEELIPTSLEMA